MQLIKDGKALENLFSKNDRNTQELLPALIEKLVMASCNKNTETHFPRGSAVFTTGVDGITSKVNCTCKHVPKGKTIWEFGTNKLNVRKITSDYCTRRDNPNIKNKKNKNFVLVTSRILNSSTKQKMEEEYTDEKVFKKVVILDANDLVSWLDAHIEVSVWLLKQFGSIINEYDVKLLIDEWDFISGATEPSLTAPLFLCGNKAQSDKFIEDLRKRDEGIFSFSSEYYGRDFALFFIVSALINTQEEALIERCMIVKSQDALFAVNSMCENKIVIVDCEIESNFSTPLKNNTYVFFGNPLFSTVSLEMTDKNNYVSILKEIGFSNSDAEQYSFLSGHNPVALRRMLSNIPSVKAPQWATDKEKYKMIPLMLIGELNMDSQASLNVLETLFNDDYDDFLFSLNYLSEINDSPVYKYDHIYRNGCRFECFNYVKVDTYLKIVLKMEDILKTLLFNQTFCGNNERKERLVYNIIQGFIILTEKNKDDQTHFDYYVDGIFNSVIGDVSKTNLIKEYIDVLAELSPLSFLRFLRKALSDEKNYLIAFCKEQRTVQYGGPSENIIYILHALRHCLSVKELAFEALEYLLDIYFTVNNGQEAEKITKELLSAIASMTGITAIPFLNKAKYFFDYINNKNIDTSKAEPIVRMYHSHSSDSIWSSSGHTYRNSVPNTFVVTYQDVFEIHDIAFEWLMRNSEDRETHVEEMFHNIHTNPFPQTEREFRLVIDGVDDLSAEQKENIRINAIKTKGNIIRFKSWSALKIYIPLLSELIQALEPKELFDKCRYILTNDYFSLENPPVEGERDYEKEEEARNKIRKRVINELVAQYGESIFERIMIECGDKSYYIWEEIKSVTTDFFRDVDNLIKNNCEKGLHCYLFGADIDTIKTVVEKYSEYDAVFKVLPLTKDVIQLLDGNKNEAVFWKSNFFYGERTITFSEVFDKFLEFNPFGIVAEMAYHQDIDYEQGLALLSKIAEFLKNDEETENIKKELHEIQEIVERMDAKYYSEELSTCEFKLLPLLMGGLRDYPLGIKKYFWTNPIALADLLISLQNNKNLVKDKTIGSKIYFDALMTLGDSCFVPKEYLIQEANKVNDWVGQMLSKCDFEKNKDASDLIIRAVVGVLSACPKVPGFNAWPTIEVADALEKIASIDGMTGHDVSSSFAIGVLNRRGVRTITNGDAEFALSNSFLKNASCYEFTHPVTYNAIKIVADDIESGGERDKRNYDLDLF